MRLVIDDVGSSRATLHSFVHYSSLSETERSRDASLAEATMGCAPSAPRRAPAKTKTESRESAWRATGIVALRDSNLRELPDKLFDADGESR